MRVATDDLLEKYGDRLFRTAFSICRDPQDAEDIVQDTLVQYLSSGKEFDSEDHVRAWLLRVAINKSKNMVMAFWKRKRVSLEEYMSDLTFEEGDRELVELVLSLPQKYRIVVHLYYYEGYSVAEISSLLGLSESAVKSRLLRARRMLRAVLEEE